MIEITGRKAESCFSHFRSVLPEGILGKNCWVAGGALREYFSRESPRTDIDLFFPSAEAMEKRRSMLKKASGVHEGFSNDRIANFTYRKRLVQIVKAAYFDSLAHTLESFDFTVCCAGTDGARVMVHEDYFLDLSARALVINKLPYPLSTLQRTQRYVKKGYTICNGGLLSIAKAIQELDLGDPEANHLAMYPDGSPRFLRID